MGKLKTIVILFEFLKCISALFAACYLLAWIIQFFSHGWWEIFNKLFGYIPDLIDEVLLIQYEITGIDVTMGYIFMALFLIIITIISLKIEHKLRNKLTLVVVEKTKEEFKKKFEIPKEVIAEKKTINPNLNQFFGLFDLKLNHIYEHTQTNVDLTELKTQYLLMLKKKLETKYPNINFAIANKLFMASQDFNGFDSLLNDIVNMFEIFQELDSQKNIKTQLLLAFDAASNNSNTKFNIKILEKIHQLNHFNRIIVLDKFVQKYSQMENTEFEETPFGMLKLELENFNDIDVETYFLKKKGPTLT